MKKLVLAIFLILLVGCNAPDVQEEEIVQQAVESYSFELRNNGIFVINNGDANITKFTIDFETRWFQSFELGPNDIGENFSRNYELNLAPGEEKSITTLLDVIPDERLEKRAHLVYFSNLILKNTNTGQVYQERYGYVAYQEGLNPWEDDAFIVGEDTYESIRQAIIDYNEKPE